MIRFVSELSE